VLTSFLLSLSQNALTIITVIRNVTAPLAKTIANATEVIVGTGKETETVAGEEETITSVSLTVIVGNAQIVVTAKGIAIGSVNAVVIVKKDARAKKRNADGSTRAKMTDVGHSAARRREAPLAVPAAAVAVNVTAAARQIAAHPHLWARSRSRSASARPAAGTSTHRVTNSTRLCRRNKPVRIALFGMGYSCC
jgi:hypothetical protein